MTTFAQVIVNFLEKSLLVDDPGLNPYSCENIVADVWLDILKLSLGDKKAITDAAQARLDQILSDPDPHDFFESEEEIFRRYQYLQRLADGSLLDPTDQLEDDEMPEDYIKSKRRNQRPKPNMD